MEERRAALKVHIDCSTCENVVGDMRRVRDVLNYHPFALAFICSPYSLSIRIRVPPYTRSHFAFRLRSRSSSRPHHTPRPTLNHEPQIRLVPP